MVNVFAGLSAAIVWLLFDNDNTRQALESLPGASNRFQVGRKGDGAGSIAPRLMFCPKCSSYLTEDDIIKKNIKYTPDGDAPVEYEAICPRCSADMGRMSWGQFTVNPGLAATPAQYEVRITDYARPPKPPKRKKQSAKSAVEKTLPAPEPPDAPPAEASSVKYCPHCGLPLPENF
jgi:hypothetical protein